MHYIQPLIGAAVILGIGYTFSTNRRATASRYGGGTNSDNDS